MPELISNPEASQFNVFAIRKDNPQPLIQIDLTWQRLMEDVVVPYDKGDLFFLDGAPVKATDLHRIKILSQGPNFGPVFRDFHGKMRNADLKIRELHAKHYHVYLEAMLREKCSDITSQVINVFRTAAKAKLSDRLPDRKQVWDATFQLLLESGKALFRQHGGQV